MKRANHDIALINNQHTTTKLNNQNNTNNTSNKSSKQSNGPKQQR